MLSWTKKVYNVSKDEKAIIILLETAFKVLESSSVK